MDKGTTHRFSAAPIGQQTVASRRQIREYRAERRFKLVGSTILTFIAGVILLNFWLGWLISDASRSLVISQDEYQQGSLFNRELVSKREELLSAKSIERKAAVLGLFRPGKKQIRRP